MIVLFVMGATVLALISLMLVNDLYDEGRDGAEVRPVRAFFMSAGAVLAAAGSLVVTTGMVFF